MAYAFAPHVVLLASLPLPSPSPNDSLRAPLRSFALIDAAQITGLRRPLQELVAHGQAMPLFENTFARAALELSPLLLPLSDERERLSAELLALDNVCRPWPVMSILRSPLAAVDLMGHLRSLLRVEADGESYLLRFADSQMLLAMNEVFSPAQRGRFFGGVHAWFTVDHRGSLHDAALEDQQEPAPADRAAPLRLDGAQTRALLDATAVPALASQVRHLDASFSQALSHAEQTEFICGCMATARAAGVTDDTELTVWALQRWKAEHARTA